MTEPRLWIEHGYLDLGDVDDFDLPGMARVSLPEWSDDQPDTAVVHLGSPGSGISVLGTVAQLRCLLRGALEALASADDRQREA